VTTTVVTLAQLIDASAAGTLPPTLTMEQLAPILGFSPWLGYKEVREGTFPVAPIRCGRRIVFPTLPCLTLLGIGSQREGPRRTDAGVPTSLTTAGSKGASSVPPE
jgi:hypothetical protein